MISKILSIVVSAFYLIIAYSSGDKEIFWKLVLILLFPLFCIWFPGSMGRYQGHSFYGRAMGAKFTATSPAGLVHFFGWILLLLPAIYILFWPQIIKFFIG